MSELLRVFAVVIFGWLVTLGVCWLAFGLGPVTAWSGVLGPAWASALALRLGWL